MGTRSGRLNVAMVSSSTLRDGGGFGGGGVERLGLAAGRNGGSANHLGRGGEGAIAGCGRDVQLDVKVGKARLLQAKRGVAREVLRREVEESEIAEAGGGCWRSDR